MTERGAGPIPARAMKLSFIAMSIVLAAGSAHAEVCDKVVGEAWRPEDGPVDVWTLADGLKVAAFVCAAWALTFAFRSRRIAFAATLLSLFLAGISAVALLWPGESDVWLSAMHEGCVSPTPHLTPIAVWVSAAIACWALPRFWGLRHA